MGRKLRHHLPGLPFHLTARIQGGTALLAGLEAAAAASICACTRRSDARLLAWAVMPNHIHLVLLQGSRPLSAYMQPLMRRLAWLVGSTRDHDGHVFGRRFHSTPCNDAHHLRNAIAYAHLNPVRAGLCATPDGVSTTSHGWYCGSPARPAMRPPELEVAAGLRLFGDGSADGPNEHAAAYRRFVAWRMEADRAEQHGRDAPIAPWCVAGDRYWATEICRWRPGELAPVRLDLRDLALRVLTEHEPGMPLEQLRSGARAPAVVRVRRIFIARARENGHRGVRIAEFLSVSNTTVAAAGERVDPTRRAG